MKNIHKKVFKVSRNCPQGVQQWEKHSFQIIYCTSVRTVRASGIWDTPHPLLPTPSRTSQKRCPKSLWPRRRFSLLPAASGTSVSSSQGQATGFSYPSPQPQVAEILFWLILQRGQVTKIEEENRRLGQCYKPTRTKRHL